MIILFVDIFLLGQPVSELSLAALRLYGYFCDFCFVFVSENKYADDRVGLYWDLYSRFAVYRTCV